MMKVIAVIPARYESLRLPGKPLAMIVGKTMIEWVYERVKRCEVDEVIVATDDERIVKAVKNFKGKVIMTKVSHKSGTDRVFEVVKKLKADLILNIQGDEPLISSSAIDDLINMMKKSNYEMGTVAVKKTDLEGADNPNIVKVVCNKNNEALYFSRCLLPFACKKSKGYLAHQGLYAYRFDFLQKFVNWGESYLENIESLEQLRALENGAKIKVLLTHKDTIGVDTQEDLDRVIEILKKRKNNV